MTDPKKIAAMSYSKLLGLPGVDGPTSPPPRGAAGNVTPNGSGGSAPDRSGHLAARRYQ